MAEEVSTEHNKKKYEFVDTRSKRMVDIMMFGGIVLMIILVSFVMHCQNNKKNKNN